MNNKKIIKIEKLKIINKVDIKGGFMSKEKIIKIIEDDINNLFSSSINKIVENAFDFNERADEYLIATHNVFKRKFKETTGTARNIEGFSELWYFLYIKKFLERFLNISFKQIETRDRSLVNYHFEADYQDQKIVICSDLSVETKFGLKIHEGKIRTDIFVGITKKDTETIPIAIFEIKLHQKKPDNIKKVVDRLKEIKDTLISNDISLPFFVFLYLQHSQYTFSEVKRAKFDFHLNEFEKLSEKSRLVVNRITQWNPWDNEIEGSIFDIMNEVVASIKSII